MWVSPDIAIIFINTILEEEGLEFNRNGLARTPYGLRHFASWRARTSTDGGEFPNLPHDKAEFYASHIKGRRDPRRSMFAKQRLVGAQLGQSGKLAA
jgi:hypothetical protein